jgi:starch synthase
VKILFASSEVAPFAKTGGLGDVGGALPHALAEHGHDVRVVMPLYPRVRAKAEARETLPFSFDVWLGGRRFGAVISQLTLIPQTPGREGSLTIFFVECAPLFERDGIYGYDDEHLRFGFFNWAALRLAQYIGFAPDIVHANDWQTALLPMMVRHVFAWDRLFINTRTVLTLHNVGHQGMFPAAKFFELGLDQARHLVHQEEMAQGRFSFLLTGILHADHITTVSPTYAREIQTDRFGAGLQDYLRMRSRDLVGILNGIDQNEWNPATDKHLPATFDASSLHRKEVNKRDLLKKAGLRHHDHVPLFGVVARLAWQKGFDIATEVLPRFLTRRAAQLVVLGTGEPKYENFFRSLQKRFPTQVAYRDAFSESLAHQIEAASDFFLMPSRYEPCGLNQMYSLRYGTLPIVHRTGGLADTVAPILPLPVRRGQATNFTETGTGFCFENHDAKGLAWALTVATDFFGNGKGRDRERFQRAQKRAMSDNWSWNARIPAYERVYGA